MKTKKGGSKALVAFSVCAGVVALGAIIATAVAIGMHMAKSPEHETEEAERRNVVVTESNVQEVIRGLEQEAEKEPVAPGYYTVTMNNQWHFANGNAVSDDAFVANNENNTNDVFFDVVLSENEDTVIYKSPVIPLGAELHDIALDTPLEAGTHNCVAIYHLVDEEQNTVDTLRVRLVIVVDQ